MLVKNRIISENDARAKNILVIDNINSLPRPRVRIMKYILRSMKKQWKEENNQDQNHFTLQYTINIPRGSLFADNIVQNRNYNFPYYLKLEEVNLEVWDKHIDDLYRIYMLRFDDSFWRGFREKYEHTDSWREAFVENIKGSEVDAEFNMIANQDWPVVNNTNMLPFLKIFVAFHTGVDVMESLVEEHDGADFLSIIRKIRLVYIRKKCDWLGGPEKIPFSTSTFWGCKGNEDARIFGLCITWFFLNYDPTFYSKYIPNFRVINPSFVDYLKRMVSIFGFYRNDDERDRTHYYHFLLTPNFCRAVIDDADSIMFHRVCFCYYFPHEEAKGSLGEVNTIRAQILSQWKESFILRFSTLITSYHISIKDKSLGRKPKPPRIPEYSESQLLNLIRNFRAFPKCH